MAIQTGFDLLYNIFVDTFIFNIGWLISVLLTFFTLMALSRNPKDWKTLAFPVMVAWHIIGIPPFFLLYIAMAMMYAIEALSLQTIGTLLTTVVRDTEITKALGERAGRVTGREELRRRRETEDQIKRQRLR